MTHEEAMKRAESVWCRCVEDVAAALQQVERETAAQTEPDLRRLRKIEAAAQALKHARETESDTAPEGYAAIQRALEGLDAALATGETET